MSPGSSQLLLNVEQNGLPVVQYPTSVKSLSGFVGFTERPPKNTPNFSCGISGKKKLPTQNQVLFVTEAQGPDQSLASHIPQAICEMHASAKHLANTIIRGALSNGHEWIFFIKPNEDGNGGEFFESKGINLMLDAEGALSRGASSLVAAIIAHWIHRGHEEIGIDDYFTTC